MKRLYILAGANGSGKSTISKVLLPTEHLVYVNPTTSPESCARTIRPPRELTPGGKRFAGLMSCWPNVYVLNGKIVWQLPDGTVTMVRPQ